MPAMIHWNPVANDLFLRAAEIEPPDERREFLDAQCGHDQALRREVESLLVSSEQVGDFLNRPAVASAEGPSATADFRPPAEGPGTVVGHYKLLQVIGEGGMGVVYLAEQSKPVERRVAVKIIKPGMDTQQVIARFEAERQALALMDHPSIAKVLDAGTTDSRHPYFVMELVKGVPITEYCDGKHLTLRERLELFLPVCQAIQHAHQKGIIHRDIKPSNVLVAQYDGRPVPKMIDFGVVKATGPRLTEKSMFTQFGQLVGTLEYMSPEQAQLNQLDIDTRSDVYSLGVLLYELLTGETPFNKSRLRSVPFDEMLRIIRDEEPPRPSTRLSSLATRPTIAASRNMEPGRLRRAVRGELDWIVMKAIEKDRARRYETASALARDVQRHLADEPVQACPPSVPYRLVKFVRRNLIATTTVAMTAALIGGGIGAWQIFERNKAQALQTQQSNFENQKVFEAMRLAQANQKLFAAASSFDRISRAGQNPRLSGEEFAPLRQELLECSLEYWDEAIRIESTRGGMPGGHASFYRRQRALCLARAGRHEQAAADAVALWTPSRERSGELAFDLARIYALCAAASKDNDELAETYSRRAVDYLSKAAATGHFKDASNSDRLVSDADLALLRSRDDWNALIRSATLQ